MSLPFLPFHSWWNSAPSFLLGQPCSFFSTDLTSCGVRVLCGKPLLPSWSSSVWVHSLEPVSCILCRLPSPSLNQPLLCSQPSHPSQQHGRTAGPWEAGYWVIRCHPHLQPQAHPQRGASWEQWKTQEDQDSAGPTSAQELVEGRRDRKHIPLHLWPASSN